MNLLVQLFFPIVQFFATTTGSFAMAIVLLTILTRILLYPLTSKQIKATFSQREKIESIQVKLKNLQEKYKDDPQELNRQTFELYQKAGVNPFRGCSYFLIQMPFLFGIYGVIREFPQRIAENPELLNQINFTLFGIDLTQVEPNILPVISAMSMFLQMHFTPVQGGANRKSMMSMNMFMMVFFFFISRQLPAGLVFYWIISTLVHTVQNFFAYRSMGLQLEGGPENK